MRIKLIDATGTDSLITLDDGNAIYEQHVKPWLAIFDTVTLDFDGVKILTPHFLNGILSQAYEIYNADWLDTHVEFLNMKGFQGQILVRVMEHQRKYWNDKDYRAACEAANKAAQDDDS